MVALLVISLSFGSGQLIGQPLSAEFYTSTKKLSPLATAAPGDQFTKITVGDVVTDDGEAVASSWADYDTDGDLDLLVINYGHNDFFYINGGEGTFTRMTAIHIIHTGNSNAGNWADYDNDGDPDLIVANNGQWYDMESWFTNNGDGSFNQIVIGTLPNDGGGSQGICWADYDNDGYVDLFIPNGFFGPEDNSLFHNNGDGTFTKITTGDIVSNGGTSRDAGWNDYDNDGDVDLLVLNSSIEDNFFYINNGDGTFKRDLSISVLQDGASSYGRAWGDYDNDGDSDLYIACLGNDALFRNNGDGSFAQDTTTIIAHDDRDTPSGTWGDFDNDGDLDLFTVNWSDEGNFLYINDGSGVFVKDTTSIVTNDPGDSQGVSSADYDNDGNLDIYVTNPDGPNFLYRNNGNGNSWINILCVGSLSNKSGIGARVRAKATIEGAPVWQLREIEGQSGHRSQNSINVEFGFGNASIIDTLTIAWPSGVFDLYTNVAVNQFITATEGQSTGVGDDAFGDLPTEFDLKQNYPNPFNPTTVIKYDLPQSSRVILRVFNMLGQEVSTLVDGEQEAGSYEVHFNPAGNASGAYFYRLQTGSYIQTRKLVLLR